MIYRLFSRNKDAIRTHGMNCELGVWPAVCAAALYVQSSSFLATCHCGRLGSIHSSAARATHFLVGRLYFRAAGRFCPGSTPRQKPFAVAADAFEAAGAVGEETAPGPPEKPPKLEGAPELKLKAEAEGEATVATPKAGTDAFAPTAGEGMPKVCAGAPKVGAVAGALKTGAAAA